MYNSYGLRDLCTSIYTTHTIYIMYNMSVKQIQKTRLNNIAISYVGNKKACVY